MTLLIIEYIRGWILWFIFLFVLICMQVGIVISCRRTFWETKCMSTTVHIIFTHFRAPVTVKCAKKEDVKKVFCSPWRCSTAACKKKSRSNTHSWHNTHYSQTLHTHTLYATTYTLTSIQKHIKSKCHSLFTLSYSSLPFCCRQLSSLDFLALIKYCHEVPYILFSYALILIIFKPQEPLLIGICTPLVYEPELSMLLQLNHGRWIKW